MKCPRAAIKHRTSKPHGPHSHGAGKSNFKNGIRGHTWEGHGPDRKCKNCGVKPRHMRKGFYPKDLIKDENRKN